MKQKVLRVRGWVRKRMRTIITAEMQWIMFSVMAGQRDQPNPGRVSVDIYCIQTSQCILMYSKGDWGKELVNVPLNRRDCCEG